MAILKIAQMGHPVLRQIADPIDPEGITGPEVQHLIGEMYETMLDADGAGIAAARPVRGLERGARDHAFASCGG